MSTNGTKANQRSTNDRPAPDVPDYLAASATLLALGQVMVAVGLGTLAASRATHHVLSADRLAALVAAAAGVLATFAWLGGTYAGAADRLAGRVRPATGDNGRPDARAARDDPLSLVTLWRSALGWGVAVAAWALAGAGLVAAVLNGRRASTVVVIASLGGLAGVAYVVVDGAGRRRGVLAVDAGSSVARPAVHGRPLRRRAWTAVALPLAISQMIVNAAIAWLLFHDDSARRTTLGAAVLTRHAAFADVLIMVVIITVTFSTLCTGWGAVDAVVGQVAPDDLTNQSLRRGTRLGAQGIVYAAGAGLVLARLEAVFVSKQPSLVEVMVARSLLAGALTLVVAASAYTRGAINAWHGTGPGGHAFPAALDGPGAGGPAEIGVPAEPGQAAETEPA